MKSLDHLRAGFCWEFAGRNWRLSNGLIGKKWKVVECQADPGSERVGDRKFYIKGMSQTYSSGNVYKCSDGKFRAQNACDSGVPGKLASL